MAPRTEGFICTYRPMRRRSSSIRNAGGRSCWWRSRYSAISSSALRVGLVSTVATKWRHTENSPRLTAGASKDEEKAGMGVSPSIFQQQPYRGPYLDDVMVITKMRFSPTGARGLSAFRLERGEALEPAHRELQVAASV